MRRWVPLIAPSRTRPAPTCRATPSAARGPGSAPGPERPSPGRQHGARLRRPESSLAGELDREQIAKPLLQVRQRRVGARHPEREHRDEMRVQRWRGRPGRVRTSHPRQHSDPEQREHEPAHQKTATAGGRGGARRCRRPRAHCPAPARWQTGRRAPGRVLARSRRRRDGGTSGRAARTDGAEPAACCAADRFPRRTLVRRPARQHLVEHAAERVDVGATVDGRPGALLRAHVRRRAGARTVGSVPRRTAAASIARAMPKSATMAWPSCSRMFSGLMSRWTTPRRWE